MNLQEKKTKIYLPDEEGIRLAAKEILQGEVVGMPTETVYGLAANAFDDSAILKIFKAKGRPQDNPLIVHIADFEMIHQVAKQVSDTAQKLVDAFWPGPLTMILPKSERISDTVSAGLQTVGIRMPSHPVARELIRACGVPLAAPSANVSGKPSTTTAEHVYYDLNGKIGVILDGGESAVGLESTVAVVEEDAVRILRPGGITVEDFLTVVSTVTVDDGVFTKLEENAKVASPGMKYKHYSPNANVIMVEGSLPDFVDYVAVHQDASTGVLVFDGEEEHFSVPVFTYGKENESSTQANHLFDALREIDRCDLNTIYARVPRKDGVGMAVYNRLLRACGFQVVKAKHSVVLGLTGQSGSGKSTVSAFFAQLGAKMIDCDQIARQVIASEEVLQKLTSCFGEDILENGILNRKKLANRAFSDEKGHTSLNQIMYPLILKEVDQQIQQGKQAGVPLLILDAPTLFESGADRFCDQVLSVLAPKKLRIERICKRDGIMEEEAEKRLSVQMTDDFYQTRSQFVLRNHGDLALLQKEVKRIADTLL